MPSIRFDFPRNRRLLKAEEFRSVFADAVRVSNACFTLLVRTNGLPWARLGLAISRKCLRKATQRVRIRRLIRESFRLRQHLLVGLDVVVLARSGAATANRLELKRALETLWHSVRQRCASCSSSSLSSTATS